MNAVRRRQVLAGVAFLLLLAFVYRALFEGRVLVGRDVFRLFLPDSDFLLQALSRGELPLWNPYTRLGMPSAATLHSQMFYPPRVVCVLLFGPALGLSLQMVLHAVIAAAGIAFLIHRLGGSVWGQFLAATVFGLGTFFTSLGSQLNVASALAWAGFIVLTAVNLSREPKWRDAAALALFTSMALLAGSPELMVWLGLLPLLVASTGPHRSRALALTTTGLAWGVVCSLVVLLPALELALHSERAVSGATGQLEWSASWPQILSMVLFLADMPRSEYWGDDQFFIHSLFLGTSVCLLAVFAPWKKRVTWVFAGLALICTLLALGRHFGPSAWLLTRPPFSLFRFPVKYAVGALFGVAVLAGLGFDRVRARFRCDPHADRRLLRVAVVLLALLGGGFALTVGLGARFGVKTGLVWASGVLALGLIAVLVARPPHRERKVAGALLGVFVLELVGTHAFIGMPYWLDTDPFMNPSPLAAKIPTPFEGRISADASLADFEREARDPEYAYIPRSREAMVPLRFVEERLSAVEGYGAPEPRHIDRLVENGTRAFFDFAGVDYYVRSKRPFDDLKAVGSWPGLPSLFHSTTALPRAYVVHEARIATDEEGLRALEDPEQPFRTTALIDSGAPLEANADCTGSRAEIREASFSEVEVLVDACAPGYLVLTDTHYPGWTVTVDEEPMPLRRAFGLVRAVHVPPGAHSVRFTYSPASFWVGAFAALFGWAAALYVLINKTAAEGGQPPRDD